MWMKFTYYYIIIIIIIIIRKINIGFEIDILIEIWTNNCKILSELYGFWSKICKKIYMYIAKKIK